MVHVVVVVPGIVGVQDDLLAPLRACVKQQIQSQGKVVEEIVTASMLRATVRVRRVDLHLVLALEEHPVRTAQTAGHVLARVPEHHLARHCLFPRLQHAHRTLRVQLQADTLRAARVPQDLHRVHVQLLVVAGEGQRRSDPRLCSVSPAVQGHLGDDRRRAVGKVQGAEAVGVARLQFTVHREVEAQPAKVQCEELLGGIIDAWVGGPERVFDLFYRRSDFGRTEREATGRERRNGSLLIDCKVSNAVENALYSPILELDKFHVKHLDALHALHDRIEDQPDAILG